MMGSELVLDCLIPYIKGNDVLNSVSLVSKKFFDIVSITRKHVTVHVHYLPDPSRLSLRFPNIESLALTSYSHGYDTAHKCCIPVTPWIQEIAVKFECLKSLSIRHMVVSPHDLMRLAKTLCHSLRSLELRGCDMFSEDGLVHIATSCTKLTSLRLVRNYIDYDANGKWLHDLALCNSGLELLHFDYLFNRFDVGDVIHLAKSLASLNSFPWSLIDFKQVFKHAKKLDHFGIGIINKDEDYTSFEFPPNIRGLRLEDLQQASFPFLRPYLHQLRELVLTYVDTIPKCQCYFFKNCPNLEVLLTSDICEDIGFQLIGQFCKKLRKLTHHGQVTHLGLKAVAKGCPDLEYLEVYLLDISNEALECVGTHLKNLLDFRIWCNSQDCIRDSPLDNGVRAMLMSCSKLERLDFNLCFGGLTDVGLGYVGKYGHNLRSLSLSHTGESDVGLFELAKGCSKLRKLKLHCCPFSEQAIATVVFNLNQSLRYIWVQPVVLTRPMISTEVIPLGLVT